MQVRSIDVQINEVSCCQNTKEVRFIGETSIIGVSFMKVCHFQGSRDSFSELYKLELLNYGDM